MKVFAARHLNRLEDEFEAADAAFLAQRDNLERAREVFREAERQNSLATVSQNVSDAELTRYWRQREDAESKVKRYQEALEKIVPARTAANEILSSVKRYIRENGLRPSFANGPDYSTPSASAAQVPKQLEKIRADIAQLAQDRGQVEKLHASRDVAEARLHAEFDHYRRRYGGFRQKIVAPEGDAVGVFGRIVGFGSEYGAPKEVFEVNPGLMLDLFYDAAIVHAGKCLDDYYRSAGPGISAAERTKKLEQIDDAVIDLQEREEALLRSAQEMGVTVARRRDASPSAIIGPIFDEAGPADEPYEVKGTIARRPNAGATAAESPFMKNGGTLSRVAQEGLSGSGDWMKE